MKRSGIRRGTGGLNRSSALGRTSAIARKSRAVARQVERDWRDARSKVDREGRCRACGVSDDEAQIEAAHTIGKVHDRPRVLEHGEPDPSGVRYVHPDDVVPLCPSCHDKYDGRTNERLDLLPHLTYVEQARAVSHVGLVAAARRLTCSRELADGLGANA